MNLQTYCLFRLINRSEAVKIYGRYLVPFMEKKRGRKSTFIYPIQKGYLFAVQYLFERRRFKKYPPNMLILAAENGRLDILKYLISQKYVKEIESAMDFAVVNGYLEIVEYLVNECNQPTSYNHLCRASTCKKLHIIQYLIEKRKIKPDSLTVFFAVYSGCLSIVQYLVEKYNAPFRIHNEYPTEMRVYLEQQKILRPNQCEDE